MNRSRFSRPPMTAEERDKKEEAFINLSDDTANKKVERKEKLKKEKIKPVYLRAPESLWVDIHEVVALTGLSMNAICLEMLRPGIKQKLKELRED